MKRLPRLVAALLFVALLLGTASVPVGSAAASVPPEPVCGVCGDPLERAAEEEGVALTIESGELAVRVDENGTGHWTARTTVNAEAADALREDSALFERIVGAAFDDGRSLVAGDAENVAAELDENTLVVTFDVPEMGREEAGGVLLVDYFNSEGSQRSTYVAADRFEVRGPEGTVLVNDPPDAREDDGAAHWSGGEDGYDYIDSGTYLVFGPDDGLATRVAAQRSIAADAAPYMVPDFVGAAFGPTLMMLFGVSGVRVLASRFEDREATPRGGGYLVAGLAAAWMVALAVVSAAFDDAGAVAWTFGAQFLVVGFAAARYPEFATLRRLLVAAVAPPVVVAGFVALLTDSPAAWNAPGVVPLVVAVALFLPLGYAVRRGTEVRAISAAIVAAPAVFVVQLLPIYGYGESLLTLLLVGWTLVALVAGVLLYRLGWTLAAEGTRTAP